MKKLTIVVLLFSLSPLALSCGDSCHDPIGDGDPARIIYFNSFETNDDAAGWTGISEGDLIGEPAPGGGEHSLRIGGGCVQPTAYIVLEPQDVEAVYSLSCWGKLFDESQPGGVVLATDEKWDQRRSTALVVDAGDWGFYRSKDQIVCPAGQRLRIEIYIGGIMGGSMMIDNITVEAVD